jgi:hypothetical protein
LPLTSTWAARIASTEGSTSFPSYPLRAMKHSTVPPNATPLTTCFSSLSTCANDAGGGTRTST